MQNKKKIIPEIYNFLRPKQTKNLARFGIEKDGGYIVEKDVVAKVNHLVSFGMSDEFSFETDFLNYNKANTIHIYDHTVNHKNYLLNIFKLFRRVITFRRSLKKLLIVISKYWLFLKFINNKRVKFFCLKITKEVNKKKEIDIDSVFSKIDESIDNIGVKFDIEGDEYIILNKIAEKTKKINFLIIEFHAIDKNKNIFIEGLINLTKYFDVIHLHGNNHGSLQNDGFPNVIEISFVNKKNNLNYTEYPTSFPIKNLDFPNNPHYPDIEINFK